MDKTKLIFVDWLGDMIYGYNVSSVTVRDLHLTRSSPGTTQGWVRAVSTGQVVLEIPPGRNNTTTLRYNLRHLENNFDKVARTTISISCLHTRYLPPPPPTT